MIFVFSWGLAPFPPKWTRPPRLGSAPFRSDALEIDNYCAEDATPFMETAPRHIYMVYASAWEDHLSLYSAGKQTVKSILKCFIVCSAVTSTGAGGSCPTFCPPPAEKASYGPGLVLNEMNYIRVGFSKWILFSMIEIDKTLGICLSSSSSQL